MGKEHKQNIFAKVAMIQNKTKVKKKKTANKQQHIHRTTICP